MKRNSIIKTMAAMSSSFSACGKHESYDENSKAVYEYADKITYG